MTPTSPPSGSETGELLRAVEKIDGLLTRDGQDNGYAAFVSMRKIWPQIKVALTRAQPQADGEAGRRYDETGEEYEARIFLNRQKRPTPSETAGVRAALETLSTWCQIERGKLSVDGYDYKSGEEFGIRRVELQIEKAIAALSTPLPSEGARAWLPRELTAENGAKAALIGEFSEEYEICSDQFAKVPISWTTIKAIWKAAVAHFDASPPPASGPLSEGERHAIGHARYQVAHASPENPDCTFDYGLVEALLKVIDRALASGEKRELTTRAELNTTKGKV